MLGRAVNGKLRPTAFAQILVEHALRLL